MWRTAGDGHHDGVHVMRDNSEPATTMRMGKVTKTRNQARTARQGHARRQICKSRCHDVVGACERHTCDGRRPDAVAVMRR